MTRKIHDPEEADDRFRTLAILSPKDSIVCYPTGPPTFDGALFVLSVVGGNTKRKDRVVVADTPPQEALSHNKTTWIVILL
jgi:hypothetical protein